MARGHMKPKVKHLESCQLEDKVQVDNLVLTRPSSWR